MKRRDALLLLAAGTALTTMDAALGDPLPEAAKSELGLVIYALSLRQKAMQAERPQEDLFEPLTYLDYCHSLGAGGVQVPLGVRDADYCRKLRERAGQYGMYVEGIVNMPKDDRDLERSRPRSARPQKLARWPSARRPFLAGATSSSRRCRSTAPPPSRAGSRCSAPCRSWSGTACDWRSRITRTGGRRSWRPCCGRRQRVCRRLRRPGQQLRAAGRPRSPWSRRWPRGPSRSTSRTRRCRSATRAFCLPTCRWARVFWT